MADYPLGVCIWTFGDLPFTPLKDEQSLTWLETYLAESRDWVRKNL